MEGSIEKADQTSGNKKPHVPVLGTPRLIPLSKWNEYHAWPPIGGLRHLAFHSAQKGCEGVFVRCRRKVLVNEEKFFEFVARENSKER